MLVSPLPSLCGRFVPGRYRCDVMGGLQVVRILKWGSCDDRSRSQPISWLRLCGLSRPSCMYLIETAFSANGDEDGRMRWDLWSFRLQRQELCKELTTSCFPFTHPGLLICPLNAYLLKVISLSSILGWVTHKGARSSLEESLVLVLIAFFIHFFYHFICLFFYSTTLDFWW